MTCRSSDLSRPTVSDQTFCAFSIVLTGRSGEKLLGVTTEVGVKLNHRNVLRTEEVTG